MPSPNCAVSWRHTSLRVRRRIGRRARVRRESLSASSSSSAAWWSSPCCPSKSWPERRSAPTTGMGLSSRNGYLSEAGRAEAVQLALKTMALAVKADARLYSTVMAQRLRRIVALFLCGWLFALGTGISAAVAGEIEHDLKCVGLANEGFGKGDAACGHGCAAHFSAHLAAIPAEASGGFSLGDDAALCPRADVPDIGAPSFRFSPPPKVSLK